MARDLKHNLSNNISLLNVVVNCMIRFVCCDVNDTTMNTITLASQNYEPESLAGYLQAKMNAANCNFNEENEEFVPH